MLELPEVVTIAEQMNDVLPGRTIEFVECEESSRKWVFFDGDSDREKAQRAYSILAGKTITGVSGDRKEIAIKTDSDHRLILWEMGGRVRFHEDSGSLPRVYDLLIRFVDGSFVTVSVQMWGFFLLLDADGYAAREAGRTSISPLDPAFSLDRFLEMTDAYESEHNKSAKAFMVNDPRPVDGIGNGYLQDILFRAGIHPKRKVRDISPDERVSLYHAIVDVMHVAIQMGGNQDERSLFDEPGHYTRILDRRTEGQPCPVCSRSIQKIQYMGGSCYFCSHCQK
jgi:formamidopyrimidine-DNA glycosylase